MPHATATTPDFVVADLSLADAGRHQLRLAENEMPGLMALREEFGPAPPLAGARIAGSLHMTVQTAVLIETLVALGAQVRWASCNIFSTQDEAAAAVAVGPTGTVDEPRGIPVFAFKGESLEEYWQLADRIVDWSAEGFDGPHLILDDGGDATLLVHKGVEFEAAGAVPPAADGDSAEYRIVLDTLWASLARDPQSKFDNKYGIRHSLPDGINRATDVLIGGTSTSSSRAPATPGSSRPTTSAPSSTSRSSATSATSTTRSTSPASRRSRAWRRSRSSRRCTSTGCRAARASSCSPRGGC